MKTSQAFREEVIFFLSLLILKRHLCATPVGWMDSVYSHSCPSSPRCRFTDLGCGLEPTLMGLWLAWFRDSGWSYLRQLQWHSLRQCCQGSCSWAWERSIFFSMHDDCQAGRPSFLPSNRLSRKTEKPKMPSPKNIGGAAYTICLVSFVFPLPPPHGWYSQWKKLYSCTN